MLASRYVSVPSAFGSRGIEARSRRAQAARRVAAAVFPLVAVLAASGVQARTIHWNQLERGLEHARLDPAGGSRSSAESVQIVRIDPARFRLVLLNASAPGEGMARSAREWSEAHRLTGAINASMYQTDYRTSVSLMRTATHVNHARVSKDRTILAFDRLDPDVPEVQIIDRDCQDFESLRTRYGSLVQSIRMVACDGRNVWSKDTRATSIACLGLDRDGRLLWIHARTPMTPHSLIRLLLESALDLKSAMYLDGGPEAQLFVRTGGKDLEFVGQSDLDLFAPETKPNAWRIPNVLGLVKKPRP